MDAVNSSVTPPRKLISVPPSYTAEAREQRIAGVVILKTVIDETGKVTEVVPVKGLPYGLTEAAVEAVRQWEFAPARDGEGNPVKVYYHLTINFHLQPPATETASPAQAGAPRG